MRVISGKYKGIRLDSPKDNSVRPTTDRIKETIFNILFSRNVVEGKAVLDLFSGSGALGIEAASRGAESVVFADASAESVKLTRENAAKTKSQFEIIHGDYKFATRKLQGRKFGLIFVDPPYRAGLYADALRQIVKYELLDVGGVVVVEHGGSADLGECESAFDSDVRKCGNTYVGFYTLKENL